MARFLELAAEQAGGEWTEPLPWPPLRDALEREFPLYLIHRARKKAGCELKPKRSRKSKIHPPKSDPGEAIKAAINAMGAPGPTPDTVFVPIEAAPLVQAVADRDFELSDDERDALITAVLTSDPDPRSIGLAPVLPRTHRLLVERFGDRCTVGQALGLGTGLDELVGELQAAALRDWAG